ncbi:1-acylglycerol-3-phosphate O [Hesseltinella vesiculosa]|uniref:1-acyl-sn-glycerol-3-phosphate acyltransferase n=1 Tax=Hesseltinella vesiculosa TaxID=101127 RepID=A0A1X2GCZ0_9FUNG|nr:1-acylglycerol-3-phosphate O [Hesseltinella vesiculosa]
MAILFLVVNALYGVFAGLILPLFGKAGLINYTVSRGYYYLGGFFTGLTCTVKGEENIMSTPAVYVCNHQSSLDVMLMGKVYPKNTAVVAKKELKYYPFLGWFMMLNNSVFLDRKNRQNAVNSAKQAADDIRKKNISIWLFPEGTRGHSSTVDLLPFKKGAFHMAVQARVPIVPVVIANYSQLYSTKDKRFLSGNVKIEVLPPVMTADLDDSSATIDKLTNQVRDAMLTSLKEISPPVVVKKSE